VERNRTYCRQKTVQHPEFFRVSIVVHLKDFMHQEWLKSTLENRSHRIINNPRTTEPPRLVDLNILVVEQVPSAAPTANWG